MDAKDPILLIIFKVVEEAEFLINEKNVEPMELRSLRTELTASIGDLGDEQQLFVESLAASVDVKSKFSHTHYQQVAVLAKEVSEYLKLNEKFTLMGRPNFLMEHITLGVIVNLFILLCAEPQPSIMIDVSWRLDAN